MVHSVSPRFPESVIGIPPNKSPCSHQLFASVAPLICCDRSDSTVWHQHIISDTAGQPTKSRWFPMYKAITMQIYYEINMQIMTATP